MEPAKRIRFGRPLFSPGYRAKANGRKSLIRLQRNSAKYFDKQNFKGFVTLDCGTRLREESGNFARRTREMMPRLDPDTVLLATDLHLLSPDK
ncbi:hypothetical protein EVAR_97492_1 [Eumeta japonica]|uniref:Uncharacterized protein n=1 Tax=Eumeta variegata TaxID=151549 RepID=A0A4C1Z9J1_EUMVA|nr:hypothetical protein EVAR_97492_1 [Eumeta japonica]